MIVLQPILATTTSRKDDLDPSCEDSLHTLAKALSGRITEASQPRSPRVHLVESPSQPHVFLPNGSRLIPIPFDSAERLRWLLRKSADTAIEAELVRLGLDAPLAIDDAPLVDPPLHALSLSIAQKCNLGCTYCYADQGSFGGASKNMPAETAHAAIDLLLGPLAPGSRAQLTFLGGEPLLNRKALRTATDYAARQASARKIQLGFSITTNGTLVEPGDADFFESHGFAVTVSLDGVGADHDRLRPFKSGAGSFDQILTRIRPLLETQRRMQVSARVTVTPVNRDLPDTLNTFIGMGFHSVGFSPLLNSSSGREEMTGSDLSYLLESMIECGLQFEQAVLQGRRYPFLNVVNALKEIGRNTHRPYPCGAGAGYMSVSADGDLAACHRFINEPAGRMGDLETGVSALLQNTWLRQRHVHQQSPCTQCWARYLCGGGCHHEVIAKGRLACDYIRGWLHYTLQAHERLRRLAPDWFAPQQSLAPDTIAPR